MIHLCFFNSFLQQKNQMKKEPKKNRNGYAIPAKKRKAGIIKPKTERRKGNRKKDFLEEE